jgi:hypothetical protein
MRDAPRSDSHKLRKKIPLFYASLNSTQQHTLQSLLLQPLTSDVPNSALTHALSRAIQEVAQLTLSTSSYPLLLATLPQLLASTYPHHRESATFLYHACFESIYDSLDVGGDAFILEMLSRMGTHLEDPSEDVRVGACLILGKASEYIELDDSRMIVSSTSLFITLERV